MSFGSYLLLLLLLLFVVICGVGVVVFYSLCSPCCVPLSSSVAPSHVRENTALDMEERQKRE